ncbi:unnamed protein product [Cuscuta epithymum]|uniref:SWIM-type domain-containing protein n=1 Tax=Cuscuta epithymum TaxID=186058 RepID=A0AAV0EQS7_9ASTE|nr:unnamed protein product [Cuscuta epithymum]
MSANVLPIDLNVAATASLDLNVSAGFNQSMTSEDTHSSSIGVSVSACPFDPLEHDLIVSRSSSDTSSSQAVSLNSNGHLDSLFVVPNFEVVSQFHPTHIAIDAVYQTKQALSFHLKVYAISNHFQYMTKTSTKKVLHVICVDVENCKWAVRGVRLSGSNMFQIKRFDSDHTCSIDFRQGRHRQATADVIAELIKHRYADASRKPYAPIDIIVDMNRDYGVMLPYKKAWNANKKAQIKSMGSDEESYQLMPFISHVLREKNPGSKISLIIDDHDRFKYFFMSLHPWFEGWKHCVPVLIIDGSFMKSYYKGTLLTACAQDANDQIFPLAFGVCDTERKDTWLWLFKMLKETLAHRDDLFIVSDRHEGIIHAARVVFPHAEHGYCVQHILGNIRTKFKGCDGLAWKFNQAARAASPAELEEYLALLDSEDAGIRPYLSAIGFEKWTRCYSRRTRYSVMTSNNAESMNSLDRIPQEYPIAKLIDFLRGRMQKWFCERRENAEKNKTILSEYFETKLRSFHAQSSMMLVKPASAYEFEVVDKTSRIFIVNLKEKTCSCRVFQLEHFICVHGVAAVGHRRGLSCYDYISNYYFTHAWLSTYSGEMHPIGSWFDWEIPDHVKSVVCKPPTCLTRPPGRPKKKRIPSTGEFPSRQRCSRCKKGGHNKKSCTNPISVSRA